MIKETTQNSLRNMLPGICIAILIGLSGYFLTSAVRSPLLEPLLIAFIFGIIIKTSWSGIRKYDPGMTIASFIFIPIGIVFYGLSNLNFNVIGKVELSRLFLILAVMFVYFLVILVLGRLLKQREQITYLTASGSGICGASAIAVISPAVKAEPDDISISLLSVSIAAFVGFAIFIPFVSAVFDLNFIDYSYLTGSTLQFTGLVKIAGNYTFHLKNDMPGSDALSLALSVKAVRYLGLLVCIPLFSSLLKKKFNIPWFLWAFIAAGVVGTLIASTKYTCYNSSLNYYVKPVHTISWSIAMAAIGLKADAKEIMSNNGGKALIMAFAGIIAAIIIFLAGIYMGA